MVELLPRGVICRLNEQDVGPTAVEHDLSHAS
jgi:hypothetical protein